MSLALVIRDDGKYVFVDETFIHFDNGTNLFDLYDFPKITERYSTQFTVLRERSKARVVRFARVPTRSRAIARVKRKGLPT